MLEEIAQCIFRCLFLFLFHKKGEGGWGGVMGRVMAQWTGVGGNAGFLLTLLFLTPF